MNNPYIPLSLRIECTRCDGTGELATSHKFECSVCKGHGWLPSAFAKYCKTISIGRLYLESDVFRDALATWLADRSCPFGLADFLRESGFHKAGDFADHAAALEDTNVMIPVVLIEELGGKCGLFPTGFASGSWRFVCNTERTYAHICTYFDMYMRDTQMHDSPLEAILDLLQMAEDCDAYDL